MKLEVTTILDGKDYFCEFYVCFDESKEEWNEVCRKIIWLNGCFQKGMYKAELLCDVGMDAKQTHLSHYMDCCVYGELRKLEVVLDLHIDNLGLNCNIPIFNNFF